MCLLSRVWATMNWRNSKKSPKWQNKCMKPKPDLKRSLAKGKPCIKKDTSNGPLLGDDLGVYTRQITLIISKEIKASPLTHVGEFVS